MKRRQSEWVYVLTAEDVAELEAALAHAEATGKAVEVRLFDASRAGGGRQAGEDTGTWRAEHPAALAPCMARLLAQPSVLAGPRFAFSPQRLAPTCFPPRRTRRM